MQDAGHRPSVVEDQAIDHRAQLEMQEPGPHLLSATRWLLPALLLEDAVMRDGAARWRWKGALLPIFVNRRRDVQVDAA